MLGNPSRAMSSAVIEFRGSGVQALAAVAKTDTADVFQRLCQRRMRGLHHLDTFRGDGPVVSWAITPASRSAISV
ncbi:hypothetical protein NBRC116597_24880 [Phaeobacter sp. NW0010-22]